MLFHDIKEEASNVFSQCKGVLNKIGFMFCQNPLANCLDVSLKGLFKKRLSGTKSVTVLDTENFPFGFEEDLTFKIVFLFNMFLREEYCFNF